MRIVRTAVGGGGVLAVLCIMGVVLFIMGAGVEVLAGIWHTRLGRPWPGLRAAAKQEGGKGRGRGDMLDRRCSSLSMFREIHVNGVVMIMITQRCFRDCMLNDCFYFHELKCV